MIGLNEERVFYWLDNGAQMSDTVHTLLKGQGVLMRWRMRNEPPVSEEDVILLDQEPAEDIEAAEERIEAAAEGPVEPEASEA